MSELPESDFDDMTREELIAEVKQWRRTTASLQFLEKMGMVKGIRKRSEATLWGLPLLSIAFGPDLDKGEVRGHARGIIAIGDIATGVLALGGVARGGLAIGGGAIGGLAIGGCAIGGIALGGLTLAILLAIGGLAVGGTAIGGLAIGIVAVGGLAAGYYVDGGMALGFHRVSPEITGFLSRFVHGLKQ